MGVAKRVTRAAAMPVAYPVAERGFPRRIVIDGVLYERAAVDGRWLTIDGQPVYMEN